MIGADRRGVIRKSGGKRQRRLFQSGGCYDPVLVPPTHPSFSASADLPGGPGTRIPCRFVSPHAKVKTVTHAPIYQTSVVRLAGAHAHAFNTGA